MKIIFSFCLFFMSLSLIFAQESVQFKSLKKSVKLPFKLLNNLIIVPIKVNGIELNFLLDSGVKETILFSLDEKKELPLFNVEKLLMKGFGAKDAIEGLKSYKNTLSLADIDFLNQEIVVVLNQEFNFSSVLGTEVNGIIGYHFFSQNKVKIDYSKKQIIIYNPTNISEKRVTAKYQEFSIVLEDAKPYINVMVNLNNRNFESKCLIDTGNSDGIWLFESKRGLISVPEKNFDDYLGRGFSGDVFGKKARIPSVSLGDFKFEGVVAAFPDSISLANVKMVKNRIGSIGGEILRRFNVVYDYKKQKIFIKKNKYFKERFKYNISGITIHHAGLQWFKEEIKMTGLIINQEKTSYKNEGTELKYNFKLIPRYEILDIRKSSPAEKSGLLVGDVLLAINGSNVYRMSLEKINELLKNEEKQILSILVARNGKELLYRFKIVDLL